jgi:N-acetylmuramoyl-L-alanine amidase
MYFFPSEEKKVAPTSAEPTQKYTTVVLDAGHGGEDGGTQSASGALEKTLNLKIAELIKKELETNGINVVMTRTEDKLLYDTSTNYKGQKKKLDAAARYKISEETPNSIFVSIHMNYFTDPKYSGLQVWYTTQNSDSQALAKIIQERNNTLFQKNNTRQIKPIDNNVYLLSLIKSPAVLIECGFLSNPLEAQSLCDSGYQIALSRSIAQSISEYIKNAQV